MSRVSRFFIAISLLIAGINTQVHAKSPPPGTGSADVPANVLFMFDTSGSMNSVIPFSYPRDVAVDSSGNVFVIDYSVDVIKKITISETLLISFGQHGSGDGEFRDPQKITIDSEDNIYIADYRNNRVQKFDNNGVWQRHFTDIYRPVTITVDQNGNVYAGNNSGLIKKWDSSGNLLTSWNNDDLTGLSAYGGFIYVVDDRDEEINKYSPTGVLQNSWSLNDNSYATDIEVNANGIYVSNRFHFVQKYSIDGAYITQWGGYGAADNEFNDVYGIGFDSTGNVYVADFDNQAIKRFDLDGVYIDRLGGADKTRLSELKKVVKKIVSTSDLTSRADFGLMEWNTEAAMRVNVSSSGATDIYNMIDSLTAGGYTVLDNAMSLAQSYLYGDNTPIIADAPCQKTILIVLSDGEWTDTQASTIAATLNSDDIKTFVIGFYTSGGVNYETLSQAGGTYPDSPLYADNWQTLYEILSNYIRHAVSASLTFTAPTIMPSVSGGDDHILQASFLYSDLHQWEGHLTKYNLNTDGSVGTEVWDAGDRLDAKTESSRQIWTALDWLGVSHSLNNFTTTNQSALETALYEDSGKTPTTTEVSNLINFIRGIDSYDEDTDSDITDKRWKLADIYHSSPIVVGLPASITTNDSNFSRTEAYYRYQNGYANFVSGTSRKEMVYVGSNGGMLHAFDSANGEEEWAFIPPNLLPLLHEVESNHANSSNSIFAVDSTPVVKDIYYGSSWKTVLLSGFGQGGHGYFALDITDPLAPTFLFAFSNDPVTKIVRYWNNAGARSEYSYVTAGTIPTEYDFSKLGETWSSPQIVLMPDSGSQKWVAVFGAGYNGGVNTDYGAALFVIDLEDGGKILSRKDLTDGTGNIANSVPATLTAITPDTTSKAVYKGAMLYVTDLEGKVWKLNLTDSGTLYDLTQLFDGEATHENASFGHYQLTPSIGTDGNLWLYYGTGNYQKLQEISTSIQNRLFGLKDTNFPNFVTVTTPATIANMKNITSTAICPTDTDIGWYFNLDANEKITGKATVNNGTVFASRYTPNASVICNPGTAKISEHDYACGNTLQVVEIGVGVPTTVVVHNNKIYVGVSDDSAEVSEAIPQDWTKTDSIVVGTPSAASQDLREVKQESWRELF